MIYQEDDLRTTITALNLEKCQAERKVIQRVWGEWIPGVNDQRYFYPCGLQVDPEIGDIEIPRSWFLALRAVHANHHNNRHVPKADDGVWEIICEKLENDGIDAKCGGCLDPE